MILHRRRLDKLVLLRADLSMIRNPMRAWSLHTRINLRTSRKVAGLRHKCRMGLLQRMLCTMRHYLWELRIELRVNRSCAVRRWVDLRENLRVWFDEYCLRRRSAHLVDGVLARRNRQLVRSVWRGWANYAVWVWSALTKSCHSGRYLRLQSVVYVWARQAECWRITRHKFTKIVVKQNRSLLTTHVRFWHLTTAHWTRFRLVRFFAQSLFIQG